MKLLPPIKDSPEDYDAIEKTIAEVFKRRIYIPLIKIFGTQALLNEFDPLLEALRFGKLQFTQGRFTGKLNARISKSLRAIGAKWDGKSFRLRLIDLPVEVDNAIRASRAHFEQKIKVIDKKLANITPEEIAGSIKLEKQFDTTLWKMDERFKKNVKNIAVMPELTADQRAKIAAEWQTNMDLWIKNFTREEILKLRKQISESVFAGNRYESAIQTIKKSFGVSQDKARFLARQETNLLMSKFKEVRYKAIGLNVYRWGCVAGTAKHPVRKTHQDCNGKYFTWDSDYEVFEDGRKKPGGVQKPGKSHDCNPGEDFNCRCYARPVVKF